MKKYSHLRNTHPTKVDKTLKTRPDKYGVQHRFKVSHFTFLLGGGIRVWGQAIDAPAGMSVWCRFNYSPRRVPKWLKKEARRVA